MKVPLILWQDDVSGVIARRGQALVASLLVGKERYRNLQVGIEQNKTTVIAETTTNMIDMISNLEEKKSVQLVRSVRSLLTIILPRKKYHV